MLYKQRNYFFSIFLSDLANILSFKSYSKKRKSSLKEIGIKNGLIEKEWNKYVKHQNINYS